MFVMAHSQYVIQVLVLVLGPSVFRMDHCALMPALLGWTK